MVSARSKKCDWFEKTRTLRSESPKYRLVYIEGKLQTRTYKDKDDVQHWKTEVISNVITPLEWKTASKKENGSTKKTAEKVSEPAGEEDLLF